MATTHAPGGTEVAPLGALVVQLMAARVTEKVVAAMPELALQCRDRSRPALRAMENHANRIKPGGNTGSPASSQGTFNRSHSSSSKLPRPEFDSGSAVA